MSYWVREARVILGHGLVTITSDIPVMARWITPRAFWPVLLLSAAQSLLLEVRFKDLIGKGFHLVVAIGRHLVEHVFAGSGLYVNRAYGGDARNQNGTRSTSKRPLDLNEDAMTGNQVLTEY